MIYYVIAALLLGAAALPRSDVRWALGWLAIALLMALGGLRFEVGTDWESYQDLFNLLVQGESFSDLREENGFLSLVKGFQFFSFSYPGFVFALFALSFSLKLYAIFKFRADVLVSLIVYIYSAFLIYDVNGLRQGLALGFVMCAGWFAVQSRPFGFIGTMALAASMHTVALVALPVYWMSNISWLSRKPLHLQYVMVGSAMVFGYALSLALAQTDASAYLDLINLAGRYYHYIDNFEQTFSPFGLGSLQRIFILGLALYMQNQLAAAGQHVHRRDIHLLCAVIQYRIHGPRQLLLQDLRHHSHLAHVQIVEDTAGDWRVLGPVGHAAVWLDIPTTQHPRRRFAALPDSIPRLNRDERKESFVLFIGGLEASVLDAALLSHGYMLAA